MKKFVIALLCTVISFATIAGETPSPILNVNGFFMKKKNVSYDICVINEDNSCSPVVSGKGILKYSIDLEVGKEYVITFTKGGLEKTLYVNVTHAGIMDLDVDFRSSHCAELNYDIYTKEYEARILIDPKYELKDNKYYANK
jgi:hypothetical protein